MRAVCIHGDAGMAGRQRAASNSLEGVEGASTEEASGSTALGFTDIMDERSSFLDGARPMKFQIDIAAYGPDGHFALIAEVRRGKGADRKWAMAMRRNMLAHGNVPHADVFMLATPDKIFVWDQNRLRASADSEPTSEVETIRAIDWVFPKLDHPALKGPTGLESLIYLWLSQISTRFDAGQIPNDGRSWLVASGLSDALRGSEVKFGVAA